MGPLPLIRTFDAEGIQLSVLERGQGQIICFSHGLLFRKEMYAAQIEALSDTYRCVAWDHRGQGDSATPPGRVATIEQCTDDAIALIEALDAGPVHFVGLSMGGFVGMRIAARRPALIRSLVLIETAADTEPVANQRKYRRLNWAARLFGITRWLSGRVEPILFGKSFLNNADRQDEVELWRTRLMSNGRRVYKAVNGVIERDACMAECARITAPVLQLHGEEDVAITEARARQTSEAIPGARFELLPGTGHSASIEQPELVTSRIRAFLEA